jgi:threonine dehydratase
LCSQIFNRFRAGQATVAGMHRLSLAHIADARRFIDPVFLDTPQFESESLSAKLGCALVVKVETLNPIGSFKARGAHFLTSQLQGQPHLVCFTAGNFGQGMAHAARARGMPITVFVSTDANPLKIQRMRALGADVRVAGNDSDETHQAAQAFAAERSAMLIQDGCEAAISEGAGTIGAELLRWPEPFDAVIVPLGDGALLGGVARWVKAHSPATRMIGVCASGAPAMRISWQRRVVSTASASTIAAGLSVQTPFAEAVADLVDLVDDILLVEDESLRAAMSLVQSELGLVLEPSGAAGIAALLTHGPQFQNARIATILTGR